MISEEMLRNLNDWDVVVRTDVQDGNPCEDEEILLVAKCMRQEDKGKSYYEQEFEARAVLSLPLDTFRLEKINCLLYSHIPSFDWDYTVDDDESINDGWWYRRATTGERALFAHVIDSQFGKMEIFEKGNARCRIPDEIRFFKEPWLYGGNERYPNKPYVMNHK